MTDRSGVLSYIIEQYYSGDLETAEAVTGYSVKQIEDWCSGQRQPQHITVEYFIHRAFTPEFQSVVEFAEFKPDQPVMAQLKNLFKGHEDRAGIYAFYDSMANLIYIGKATNLVKEAYSAIRRDVDIQFPTGIRKKPEKRYEIVRYISAYDVGSSDWLDYPKHVESLILRISKPALNKNIGHIEQAYAPPGAD
ncbi:hypothetical protein C4K22_2481 [Pseudomonas chlororaphis subsp. aurantiaca]|uniref:GIY-YIG domain-containing protein n=1 Tax=Pseudomonas chlororaphis subsp. aurantiaca TaxID=86192 RepID=A0AAJ0ZGU0_9PSED|nr:hypothetical protein [Pseudomonas chlororaphis]AIS13594.1 hypothetical protein JM49_18640 [Pseudomonas chlororaphis subsp. aurantiaca]AZD21672.1 hypothetical protein C4K24_2369 [Pseudomonas chlororaphis subsp. aurantiaca]AZD35224.1 hypothetical protein C4K22_2481 [Pseudomonas chlororaphis subsp. aurantiaca]AZD41558.1 hypothetical protein C4K21_2484 [Pseudomonas chlororaphis subsp. aurantiaca]AZD54202.1 hypothetical protein C4K19_2415 [Pseudomonas chlororaphis subsp. aurantiaca]